MIKVDESKDLIIRTMKGDLARLRQGLESKEKERVEKKAEPEAKSADSASVATSAKEAAERRQAESRREKEELPSIEKKPRELVKVEKKVLKEKPKELPKEKEEPIKQAPPPLGLPTIERRLPTPPPIPLEPPVSPKPSVTPPPPLPKPPVILPSPPEAPKEKPVPLKPKASKALKIPKVRGISKISKVSGTSRTLLLGGIVIALGITAFFVFWFFFVIPEPSSPAPPSPPILPQELIKPTPLVSVQRQIIIELEEGKDLTTELKGEIGEEVPSGLSQILVYKDSLSPLSLEKIFEEFSLVVPQSLINNFDEDYTLLLFAQEEFLIATGTPSRLGFVTQVKNTTISSQIMELWEETMAEDLEGFYLAPCGERATEEFSDDTYKTLDIHFLNFPMRDITIDYTLYSEENWLILATSRQFIYRIIDLLEE